MITGIFLTVALAFGWLELKFSHIQLAIPAFIFTIFAQAFVMFYFIGVSRLVDNVAMILTSKSNLHEIFDTPPADLSPYITKVRQYVADTTRSKRQTIPWTMMMLILGMLAFLLGGAHDTGLVAQQIHTGVVYGFLAAMMIGFVRQWYYLGKTHHTLRSFKALFSIPDDSM